MILDFWNRKKQKAKSVAKVIYGQIMTQSRHPAFYTTGQEPDNPEGRFEILTLHASLIVNRLCAADMGKDGRILAQAIFDTMFRDLDWSLREMGVGDLGVPRRIKKMMTEFKGRAYAYSEALRSSEAEVRHALIRNLYAGRFDKHEKSLDFMTGYILNAARMVDQKGLSDFWMGKVEFPGLAAGQEDNDDYRQAA